MSCHHNSEPIFLSSYNRGNSASCSPNVEEDKLVPDEPRGVVEGQGEEEVYVHGDAATVEAAAQAEHYGGRGHKTSKDAVLVRSGLSIHLLNVPND
jgi:hypothetical protein